MSRPIPVSLLIHSAALNDVITDNYQAEQDNLAAMLYHVRIEPSERVVTNANGTDIQCTAMMFVDAQNSQPPGIVISVGQSVVWEGIRYKVADVQRLYDETKLHHLEVELSDG